MRVEDLASSFALSIVLDVGQGHELLIGHHLHAKSISAVVLLFLGPAPVPLIKCNPVVIKTFVKSL